MSVLISPHENRAFAAWGCRGGAACLAALRAKAGSQARSITLKKMTVVEMKTNADDSRQAISKQPRQPADMQGIPNDADALTD